MQILYSIYRWIALTPPILLTVQFLLITGAVFLFFYVWKKTKYFYLKIQQSFPDKKHVSREIGYCIVSSLIFGGVIWLVNLASHEGYTRVYRPIDKYGYVYFVFSIFLMIFIHDAYFYWSHRLLHWKPLFKKVHIIHHLSVNPTPFSAYAFHPVEALMQAGVIPLVVFTVPYNPLTLSIFLSYALIMNILGHMGFEVFPRRFATKKMSSWHNTPTHHNMHHRFVKYNFGLYFNIWDRLMKTNHPHYVKTFDEVVARRDAPLRDAAGVAPDNQQTTAEVVEDVELMNEGQ